MSKITIEFDNHHMTIEGHETRDLVPDHALGMIYDRDEKIKELRADMDHYRSVVLGRIGRPEIGLTEEQYDMIKAVVP